MGTLAGEATPQQLFDAAIRGSPDAVRAIADILPECVKVISPEGEVLYISPAGLGLAETDDASALRGKCVFDLVDEADRPDWKERHLRVCSGETLTWQFHVVGMRGGRRTVETTAAPIRLADGRVGQLAVSRDISRRSDDESARAHLAAIVESSDDAIVSKTLEGTIRTWNAGAQRIFGYTAEEAIGRPVLMLLPPDRTDEETGILARLRGGERVDHFESVRVTKDGRSIDVSLTISPIRNAAGQIVGASKVARDITRQKQVERELQVAKAEADDANRQKDQLLESERHARGEAERASRMKDEFLANLSHELRTPLNAVLGWSQLLRRDPSPDDVRDGMQIIERNARAQAQIIEDLLDMSRIISGKLRLEVQPVDLQMVLREAIETVRPAAEAREVRVQAALDPFAGPVNGDPSRLQQVFWNLLTNAVKFTPKGGGVQVTLRRVNSHLEANVADTGEGIDPDFLPLVFDRFRQADGGTARKHGGLGLGLAITKQLVELHGGTIRVHSDGRGKGASFTVAIPLMSVQGGGDSDMRSTAANVTAVMAAPSVRIGGVKVLVVDDEPDARALVERLLQSHGAVVTTAGSAREAFRLLAERPHDVLVSDIGMPDEDGYTLIRRIRGNGQHAGGQIPAIALTAYARAEDRLRAIMAGFDQYAVKPVEPAELITLVAILAERANGSR